MFECEVSLVYPAQVPEQPVPCKEILIKKKNKAGCGGAGLQSQCCGGADRQLPGATWSVSPSLGEPVSQNKVAGTKRIPAVAVVRWLLHS